MKKQIRIMALLLCLATLLGVSTALTYAAPATIAGVDKTETQTIKVGGTDTGVTLTQMTLNQGSAYSKGTTGLVNVVEAKLSSKVTMKVLNGGAYTWSKATMGASTVAYNKTHDDSTVIAAVNGDPWIVYHTDYDGDGVKATGDSVKHVSVSRGVMIINGELWASHQIDDENNLALQDNVERGTPAARNPVFGIKNDGTVLIGTPYVAVKLQNTTTGTTQAAGGINRLPAPNSIILYNQRCGTESFAYADAYEIYVNCENAAFSLSENTVGTVTAIFESGDTSPRPAIDQNTVVISARGKSVSTLKDKYKVGDGVTVACAVTRDDSTGSQRKQWADVKEAIGSFFYLVEKGNSKGQPGNATNYPCSIIGIKKDGTVLMTTTTSVEDGTRQACQMQNLPAMCKELGYHTALLFDGGGSTEMVTLEGDNYVRRSATVDGANSVRAVISGIAVVYNGVNVEPGNQETKNTVTYPSLGITQEVPDDPTLPDGVDFVGAPSYSYRYYAAIETINGNKQTNLFGRRDPAYVSSWSTDQKKASIQPGTVSGVTVDANNRLILSGYAFVNGGQGVHYWSIDKENWYACTDGVLTDGDREIENIATTEGALNSSTVTDARFENLTADLSAYKGETVTVYFGITAKHDTSKMCHYLTVESIAVPTDETEAPTAAPTEPPTEAPTEVPTDPSTEEPTDVPTEEPTEQPTEQPTDAPTVAPTDAPATDMPTELGTDVPGDETDAPKKSGCSAVVVGGMGMLLLSAAAVAFIKRKD